MKVMRSEMRSTSTVLCEENRIERLVVAQHVHELAEHFVARHRVEAGGRLVEDQQPRAARQRQQQHRLDVFALRQRR